MITALTLLTSVLVWTLVERAGLDLAGWEAGALPVAVLAIVVMWRGQAPPPGRWVMAALIGLPVWVLFTMFTTSLAPAASYAGWLHLATYILVFLVVREVAWRASWIAAVPLIAVVALEAALGLAQFYGGAAEGTGAHGTFVNRDHFAGLLEMALPFAVMGGFAALGRGVTLGRAVRASCAFGAAVLILAATIHSLSRMGFLCAIVGLVVAGAVTVRRKRWLLAGPVVAVLLFVFLPTDPLIARFGESGSLDRVRVWRETLPMVPDYVLTGCGLGGYESAFMRYKRSGATVTDSFVHNDYLQYLVELGVPGFVLGVVLVAAVLRTAARAALGQASPAGRALGAACLASMTALLLHSVVDFNSYIPSNALVFAWVAGLASDGGVIRV